MVLPLEQREKLYRHRDLLVDWNNSIDALRAHIVNGAARGLYSQRVAQTALQAMEPQSELMLDHLVDIAQERV